MSLRKPLVFLFSAALLGQFAPQRAHAIREPDPEPSSARRSSSGPAFPRRPGCRGYTARSLPERS